MSQASIRVGICGLGTVASGVVNTLLDNRDLIARRAGGLIDIVHIGARRDNPNCDTANLKVSRDIFDVANDPEVDILIELIGGTTTARELVETALKAGKHVVTANKALIAEAGNELFALAEAQGVTLRFEAAVAGGIPVIKTLREALSANRIDSVAGIINGTGNFILTEMAAKGRSFESVLEEAQALGYAEADPTFDIDGTDAAHKLVILASLAFGMPLDISAPFTEGIDRVAPEDLENAKALGYRIKHLGIARVVGDAVEMRVHPTLIPQDKQIATVDGVLNAVQIKGDAVGEVLLVGPGAGAGPTASSVCSDVIDLARVLTNQQSCVVPPLGCLTSQLVARPVITRAEIVSSWYLRLTAENRPGVMSAITRLLGDEGISIESMIQKTHKSGSRAPIVLVTNATSAAALDRACDQIAALDTVGEAITRLRVESFDA